ncbi:MAG TPA: DUF3014 domain-containing protein [Stenotrophomonas sp.]|jgi:hypothetical protein
MQNEQARWPWVTGILLAIGLGVWLFRPAATGDASTASTSASARVPVDSAATGKPAAAAASPVIAHPIEADVAADAAIPALADSDAAAGSALSDLVGDEGAMAILLRDHLVQRLVVLVDNLPERSITLRALPYRPLATPIATSQEAGRQVLDATANGQRYAPFVRAFVHVDAATLATAYRRFYPLFQQAYSELGTKGYFNDRLVAVIDHLLQTPVPNVPVAVEPASNGRLRFVDPALESLSVGQKALLRLGPEQAAAVKQQLRAIREQIARG